MARRDHEMSCTDAAEVLEVHVDTVRRWVAAELAGETSPLRDPAAPSVPQARRDIVGRLWLRRARVDAIRAEHESHLTTPAA